MSAVCCSYLYLLLSIFQTPGVDNYFSCNPLVDIADLILTVTPVLCNSITRVSGWLVERF